MEPLKPSRSAAQTAAAPTAAVEGHAPERAPATTARTASTQNVIATRTVKTAAPASADARTSPTATRPQTPAANRPPPKPTAQQPAPASPTTPQPKTARTIEPTVSKQPVPRPKLATLSDAESATGTSQQRPARPQRGATGAELTAAPNSPRKSDAQGQRQQPPNATPAPAAQVRIPRPQTPNATSAAATPIQVPRVQTTSATSAAEAAIARRPSSQQSATKPAFQRAKLASSADLAAGSSAGSMPSPFDAAAAAFPHTEASSSIDVTESMLLNSKPSAVDVTDSMLTHSKPSAIDVTDSMLTHSRPSSSDGDDAGFSAAEPSSSIDVTDAMIVGSKPSYTGTVPSLPFLELQSDEELESIGDQASAPLETRSSPALPDRASSDATLEPHDSNTGSMLEDGSAAPPRERLTDVVATQSLSVARSSDHELTPSASTFAPRDLAEKSERRGSFAIRKTFVLRAAIVAGVVSIGGLVGLFVYSGKTSDDSASSIQAAAPPSKPDAKASPRAAPPTPRPADVTASNKTNQEAPKPVAPEVPPVTPSADGKADPVADTTSKPSGIDAAKNVDSPKSVDAPTIPDYVNKPTLLFVSDVAVRRSQRCHPQGHAVGTSQLFVTFSPNGRVSDARLEGEPLASAPVAKCILSHARAIQMPKFKGPAFTHVISVTLR